MLVSLQNMTNAKAKAGKQRTTHGNSTILSWVSEILTLGSFKVSSLYSKVFKKEKVFFFFNVIYALIIPQLYQSLSLSEQCV